MTESTKIEPEYLTVSELAKKLDLTVQAVSNRVGKLEALGLITTKKGHGPSKLVPVADYMKAIRQTGDPDKTRGWKTRMGAPDGETYLEEQVRKIRLDSELRALQVGKMKGDLVPIRSVEASLSVAAGRIVRVLDRLPTRTDELIACVRDNSANPVPKVRALLKQVVRDIRTEMASAMTDVVAIGANAEAAGTVSFEIELEDENVCNDQPE
jgi:DNA-binding Lrp family transcriptional regulator